MTRNHRIRFMANNYFGTDTTYSFSSELAAAPMSNLLDPRRSKVARFGGNFTVTAANKNVYINDGSDKTVALTEGSYTYATLATHVAARLNAASSAWTCTYDFAGGTFKFAIGHTGAATLRFSQTTSAAWSMLGFTGSSDVAGTSWTADEQRNHTEEWIEFDFLTPRPLDFFAVVGRISRPFGLSALANARFQANSLSSWAAPALDLALTTHDLGLMRFQDDQADWTYRRARYYFSDPLNTCGPEGFEIGRLYVGDYVTFEKTNISRGFSDQIVDPSEKFESNAGVNFWELRPKYRTFTDNRVGYVPAADRAVMKDLYRDVGQSGDFFVALDPLVRISSDLQEFAALVTFDRDTSFQHVHNDRFAWSFGVREVI